MAGLADVPFYGAYRQVGLENEVTRPAAELQQTQAAMGLMGALQKQRQEAAFRDAMSRATTPEEQVAVASKFASPDKLIDIQQRSIDRREAAEARALQFAQNLELRQQQLQQQRELAESRLQNDRDRQQFEQWYRTQALTLQQQNNALNAHLRSLGLEIQRQGNDIRIGQINQANLDRENREIETQIGKTSDRMKDVMPVWTSAQQLNNILSQFTPKDVPGVGYLKNTDIGKFFLSGTGKDVSSSIKLFGNSVLKAMSGAAVTAPEEIRQMAAQMADGRFSAEDFYIAWPKMSQWVNDQVRLSTAGLTPKAKERFLERTGLKLDPITPRFVFEKGALKDTAAPMPNSLVPANPESGSPVPMPGSLSGAEIGGQAIPMPGSLAEVPPPPPGFKLNK